MHRGVLSSQEAILQLLSALLSLTSVFGMGTGVTSMPSSQHVLFLTSMTLFYVNINTVSIPTISLMPRILETKSTFLKDAPITSANSIKSA